MAIYAQCEVQIVELKRLTNVIISLSSSNKMGFRWHKPKHLGIFPFIPREDVFVSLIMYVSAAPPHFSLLIILHQCFHLKVKDVIEHRQLICFFKKMKENT